MEASQIDTAMGFRRTLSSLTVLLLASAACGLALDILPVTKSPEEGKDVEAPVVTLEQLNDAYDQAVSEAKSRKELEDNLPPSGLVQATSKSVEARHQRFLAFDQTIADLDLNASLFLSGSTYLKEKLGLTNDQATFGLSKVPIPSGSKWSNTRKQCQKLFQASPCDKTSKFRTSDGTCNNLEHPEWGKSHSCMGRFLPQVFDDGLSEPRMSASGTALPNVRSISLQVHEALVTPNASYTHMVMQFGQFVTHDVTMGLMTRTITNQTMISCCPFGESKHPECNLGIIIPPNKSDFFSNYGQTCMNFVRGALCDDRCSFGARDQSSRVTAYADSSNVYGSNDEDMNDVRAFKDGLLLSQSTSSGEFLPHNDYPTTDQCTSLEDNLRCFKAGDKRVNENPALTSLHNLFLRQHNRLARLFKKTHPDYNDEQLFQLTRRVVNGQYQNVVFGQFLPAVLGQKYMKYFSLNTGDESVYDPDLQVTIFNEFMTSALRFGHTLIQNTLQRGASTKNALNLDEVYFSPFILMQGDFDPIVSGLASQPAKLFERHLTTAVTHTLYRQKEVLFGMDLASLNIQRGRDHGTAAYTKYIKHCFNITIKNFEDLDQFMTKENRMNLQAVYKSPEDIDLFTGGVSENNLTDAAVGPTFGCILGAQFYRFKFGDRWYFENEKQPGSFTEKQMKALRNASLANIICENTNSVSEILPNVFKTASDTNKFTPCDQILGFDHTIF